MHPAQRIATFLVVSGLLVASLAAQSRLPNHRVSNAAAIAPAGLFGQHAVALGDFDGDGVDDYAVAAPSFVPNATVGSVGRVYLYSGLTSQVIRTFDGIQPSVFFGEAMADAGDVNGDGVRDIVITARAYSSPTVVQAGRVTMFSGATGAELWSFEGPGGGNFGQSVAVFTDGTLTGATSIAVGHPGFVVPTFFGRVVYLDPATGFFQDDDLGLFAFDSLGVGLFAEPGAGAWSSSGGGRVFALDGPGLSPTASLVFQNPGGDNLPAQLAWIDSPVPSLVVGRPNGDSNGFSNNGTIDIYPGGAATSVMTFEGTATAEQAGADVITGDFDGDGEDEIGFSSATGPLGWRFRIVKQNGTVVEDVFSAAPAAATYASLGDTTGDGRDEWLQSFNGGPGGWFEAQLFGAGMFDIVVAGPSFTNFVYVIDMSPLRAGDIRFTFFGVSGTAPGTVLEPDKPLFPLNFDMATTAALGMLGMPTFPDSLGVLDVFGVGVTNVVVPAALASMASGAEFFAATVLLDFASLQITGVTNPVRSVFP